MEVDLSGQIVSSAYGTRVYSGISLRETGYLRAHVRNSTKVLNLFSGAGGQEDFIRGASWSEGGKPIIGMHSLTSSGESAIRPFLTQGAAVLCSRALVRYLVTEHGIAFLFGKNLRQRAHALINIAHPDFR